MALVLKQIDEIVWGPMLLFLLLGTGLYLTIRLRGLPFRNLKFALRCMIGWEDKKNSADGVSLIRDRKTSGISSFSALTTELAATIGTGNIVGVSTALVLGGPGALFWMIVSALLGLGTKLVESMLAVKYRQRNEKGEYVGGPMYTLKNAFPDQKIGALLAVFFAVFAVLASFGMGNMTQANAIASAMAQSFGMPKAKTGFILTMLTIFIVLGGIHQIARVTQILVPFMGALYIVGTLVVIGRHIGNVPFACVQMVVMAFCPQAVTGGLLGSLLVSAKDALRFGVSRGVFSNEAGLGASGISAAAANTDDYIKQGYISMTGVFFDTLVICVLTGMSILVSGVLGQVDEAGNQMTGISLAMAAFQTGLGESGGVFLSVSIALFAFATIASWCYQGEKAFEYLFPGERMQMVYRFAYAMVTLPGAVYSLEIVWSFSDICNALLAIPNLICILVLAPQACREIRQYG